MMHGCMHEAQVAQLLISSYYANPSLYNHFPCSSIYVACFEQVDHIFIELAGAVNNTEVGSTIDACI